MSEQQKLVDGVMQDLPGMRRCLEVQGLRYYNLRLLAVAEQLKKTESALADVMCQRNDFEQKLYASRNEARVANQKLTDERDAVQTAFADVTGERNRAWTRLKNADEIIDAYKKEVKRLNDDLFSARCERDEQRDLRRNGDKEFVAVRDQRDKLAEAVAYRAQQEKLRAEAAPRGESSATAATTRRSVRAAL